MKKEETLFFTGHRNVDFTEGSHEYKLLESAVIRYAMKGYKYFVAGGALGFDTCCAKCVLSLKERGLDIFLVLMLPCRDQDARWNEGQKREYRDIIALADKIIYTAQEYKRGCMHARDRAMADASSACIAYCKRQSGGTAYTVKYASGKGMSIDNLAVLSMGV